MRHNRLSVETLRKLSETSKLRDPKKVPALVDIIPILVESIIEAYSKIDECEEECDYFENELEKIISEKGDSFPTLH